MRPGHQDECLDFVVEAEVDVAQLLRTRIPLREQRVQERLPALPAIRLCNALEESTGIVVLNVGCEIQHVRT